MRIMQDITWKLIAAGLLALTLASTDLMGQPVAEGPNTLHLLVPKVGNPRPVIAVLADNAGTETTDFVIPYSILKESAVADVMSVSLTSGNVTLMPALTVRADMTLKEFDQAHAAGADIVIVPALHHRRTPQVLGWLRRQADRGAVVVSICEGAWVTAEAGLLRGKQATTHWFALNSIARHFPATTWRRDRRFVIDGQVMTTTGVSASIPASLAIVESIAGHITALETAQRLGLEAWSPHHDSASFTLSARNVLTVAANWLPVWRHETIDFHIDNGCDEIALALAADAWSRTYRSQARAVSSIERVHCRHGLTLLTERAATSGHAVVGALAPAAGGALDAALRAIADRYGEPTADLVSLGLEYRYSAPSAPTASAAQGARHQSRVGG